MGALEKIAGIAKKASGLTRIFGMLKDFEDLKKIVKARYDGVGAKIISADVDVHADRVDVEAEIATESEVFSIHMSKGYGSSKNDKLSIVKTVGTVDWSVGIKKFDLDLDLDKHWTRVDLEYRAEWEGEDGEDHEITLVASRKMKLF